LKSYRGKVSALSGQEQLELETSASTDKPLSLIDKSTIDKPGIDDATVDKASA
jgi:hypothetical protein